MEKVIQVFHAMHTEASALGREALGILLLTCIIVGLVVVFWIFTGSLRVRSTHEFFATPREIERWLKNGNL